MSYKKINKFIKNPNLFFFDFFKKRVIAGNHSMADSFSTVAVSDNNAKMPLINKCDDYNMNISYLSNTMSLMGDGIRDDIKRYVKSNFSLIPSAKEIYLWDGYTSAFVRFISFVKENYSFKIDIYQAKGVTHYKYDYNSGMNINNLTKALSSHNSFIVEMINPIGEHIIFNVHQCNNVEPNVFMVKSNGLPFKKFNLNSINTLSIAEPQLDIDIVYTWVNKDDPVWQELWNNQYPDNTFDPDRFSSNDELKYSLRSIGMYAPWVKKIYIVSNCTPPHWLNVDDNKVKWVYHSDIYPSEDYLPVFNSHSIETCLHRIPGLSENFIYFNDDVFLSQPCQSTDFFDRLGRSYSFYEPYGMVGGVAFTEDTPSYMKAAMNGANILFESFGYYPRNLLKHTPHPLKKSILKEIEDVYAGIIDRVRRAKLRSDDDISLTSFFFHHYSYLNGTSIPSECNYALVRAKNYKKSFQHSYSYKFMCLNDGGGDSENKAYKQASLNFMNQRYPIIQAWEK